MKLNVTKTFEMLTVAFGESTKSITQCQMGYNWLKEGREDVSNVVRLGRPSTSTTGENIEAVKKMILDNRGITTRDRELLILAYRFTHPKQFLQMKCVELTIVSKLLNNVTWTMIHIC